MHARALTMVLLFFFFFFSSSFQLCVVCPSVEQC